MNGVFLCTVGLIDFTVLTTCGTHLELLVFHELSALTLVSVDQLLVDLAGSSTMLTDLLFQLGQLRPTIVDCVELLVSEPPTASPRKGTSVLWVLTGTHPCDATPRQVDVTPERQLLLAWLWRCLCHHVSNFSC